MTKELDYWPSLGNAGTACGNHHFMVAELFPPNIHVYALNGEKVHEFTCRDPQLQDQTHLYGIRMNADSILSVACGDFLTATSICAFKVWNINTQQWLFIRTKILHSLAKVLFVSLSHTVSWEHVLN